MSEENWYRARQLLPDSILRCEHGMSPVCLCIRRFNIDKKCPLTERQVTVAVASFELKRIERLSIEDDQKYKLLRDITQCIEGEEDTCIEAYELLYGPLVPKRTITVPELGLPTKSEQDKEDSYIKDDKPLHDPLVQKPTITLPEPDPPTLPPKRNQLNIFRPDLLMFLISMGFIVFFVIVNSFK
jgi:hypothetical protein